MLWFLGIWVCNLIAQMVYSGALCIFIVRHSSQSTFIFGNENLSIDLSRCGYPSGSCLKSHKLKLVHKSKWEHMYDVII